MTQLSALPVPSLSAEKTALAAQLVHGLDAAALHWLSGYMAGAAASSPEGAALPSPHPAAERLQLTVLYGSQSGNTKRVAEQLAARAEAEGMTVRLLRADAYPLHELKTERLLYVVISTHSTGDTVEPPDDSRALFEHLHGRRAPRLPKLAYAVLGLGDTSYPEFCVIGQKVDQRLAELGARRLFARGDADVDIETVANPWTETALTEARALLQENSARSGQAMPDGVVTPLHPVRTAWTRQHPFQAEVLVNQRIVANASDKDVRHIELLLEGSGITYQPGDALGVWPTQSSALVDAVLDTLDLDGGSAVAVGPETRSLSEWLSQKRELTGLTQPFLAAHAERADSDALRALLEPDARDALTTLLGNTPLLDLLRQYPAHWNADALVAALRPLAPRMYSIASSPRYGEEEVHLTVDRLHYRSGEEDRWGVASHHLCALAEGDRVPVFIEANERFRLPTDPNRDIIMIGPGTGVAPFRAFVQEREATSANGRNWLIFGDRHRRTDFLYQLEWQAALKSGALQRLDVAFSRDQDDKLYVQHRLREHGRNLYNWLASGAHLYVCGDATHMARDVNAALIDIIAEHGGKSREDATTYLNGLLAEGRYARDVY